MMKCEKEDKMPRINVKEADPVRYAQIKAEQEALRKQFSGLTVARLCPTATTKLKCCTVEAMEPVL